MRTMMEPPMWLIGIAGIWMLSAASVAQRQPTQGDLASAVARRHADFAKLIAAEYQPAKDRLARIRAELAAMKGHEPAEPAWARDWAGIYARPEGTGFESMSVGLAPDAGFAYIDRTDATLCDVNHGDVVGEVEGGIRLRLAIEPGLDSFQIASETNYFIKWGECRYLVPECRMAAFCRSYNAAAGFTSDYIEQFPLRVEDHKKPANGSPAVPPQFAARILNGPVQAGIASVETSIQVHGTVQGTATLNKGSANGLYPGMKIWYRDDLSLRSLLVESVTDHTCKASFSFGGTLLGSAVAPVAGQVVSTRRQP